MSEPTERDLDALIKQLEEEEHDLSLRRKKLHDRMALFPDDKIELDLTLREADLSQQRRDLHRRIDELRAQRNLLRDQRSGRLD
jgi:predicted  nucleic acid-binding Zn-ribbon protein